MKVFHLKVIACALAFVALAGCGAGNTENLKAVFADLQTCERHYNGSLAVGTAGISDNVTVTMQIDCKPMQGVTSGVTTTPAQTVPLPSPVKQQ
jgi:hypothetical protein